MPDTADSALGDRLNMAFKGTVATHGRARGLVVATGRATELGKVAKLLDQEDRTTPLQRRLAAFGKRLALLVIGIRVVIFVAGIWRGEPALLMALTAISLAVAAIPEALPAVVSVLLALGARRMVAMHALVRRLPSVETLGSVTTICSDKTGTLTQNKMHAELAWASDQTWVPGESPPAPVLRQALRAAALCNDARQNSEASAKETWQGDPTETALVMAAQFGGEDKAALDAEWPRLKELPFDSERKRMTTLHHSAAGFVGYTKGSPESVLAAATLLDDNFATIVAAVHEGRRIYDNIRKFVRYAMTGNSVEIWTLFLAPMLFLPIPLLPIHILWVNLVTDGLPGLALAAEPAERGVMQRPPRAPNEGLFANGMWQHILGIGLLIAGLCLGVQAWALATLPTGRPWCSPC